VLTRQPSDVQDCLMRTSVLNRFSPALAEALCEAERGKDEHRLSGQEFIEWLVKANLFVVPLDGERTWFRYHHLFQQLLQNRLKTRRSPEQIAAYHATASTWYRENRHIEEAIQHAIAAGDAETAAQIVEESRYAILDDDKWYVLSRWLEMLPGEIKRQRPDLLLAQAWVSFYRLDYVAVSTFVEEVQKIAGGDKQHPTLRGELDFFRGYFQYWQDEASQSEESLRNAVEVIPERYKMMRGEAELHYGLALKMNGKGEEALRMLHDLLYVRRIPEDARRARVVGGLCFIGLLEGELEEVVNASQQLQSLGSNLKSSYLEVWAHYFQACVAYLRNDLERAVQLFDKVVMNRYILDPRFAVDAIAGLALAHQLRGEAGKAGETLQLLEDFASETNDLVCLSVIRSTQAHLSLVQGDAEAALRCQQMLNLEYDTGAMFTWLELPRLTRCRVLLAEGSPASVTEALEDLEEYAEYNESRCNDLQLIRVLGLQALAYAKQSKTDEATSLLARALTIARRGRFIRPFLDLGPPVAELLERLGEEDAPADYVGKILKAFTQDRGRTKGGALEMRAESSVESLSQRELEILTLMAEGLRNDEIAGRLFISGGTVKNHLYNIYQKLGAHNRIRALDKARELGFLAAQ
ncbi:MAG: LuxR C-terminal-related transcriptional regulator, partial [Bacteroidota bacterium]